MASLTQFLNPATLLGAFTAGESAVDATAKARELTDSGRLVALEHAPGDDPARSMSDLARVMTLVAAEGLAPVVELIVLPETLGGSFAELVALSHDLRLAVMIGLGPQSNVREHLVLYEELRQSDDGAVGICLPASWRDTERLCTQLTGRVRIVKGADAFGLARSDRFSHDLEVDKAFVRAARALIPRAASDVHPSLATQDGRLIEIAESLAARARLPKGRVEFAMHLGRAGGLQERLVAAGESVRVTVPFGPGRLERLASGVLERPGGIVGAVRSLVLPSK